MGWLERIYDACRASHPELPAFIPFWDRGHARLDHSDDAPKPQVRLAEFVADPAAHRLSTPSGRIEIVSATNGSFGYDDCPGNPAWLDPG